MDASVCGELFYCMFLLDATWFFLSTTQCTSSYELPFKEFGQVCAL